MTFFILFVDAFFRCLVVFYINHLHPESLSNLGFIFKGKLSLRFSFSLALGINKLDLPVDYCSNPGKFVLVVLKIILCFICLVCAYGSSPLAEAHRIVIL